MFTANLRVKVIHIALIAVVFSSALTPNETLAKASFAQSDPAYSSVDLQTESSLVQTPEVLIQCVGALSACSDLNPGTTVTETLDFTNDDRRIEFKILCEGWNCPKRDIYYSVTMDVEWGNGIDAPWFYEYATLSTSPGGSGGSVNMPCGGGLSGSCTLSTSGIISADDISPDPNANWHFGINNTGGTSATYEWHHRVLNIIVSFDPIPNSNCSGTPLSPIAQAVLEKVDTQVYCGNYYDSDSSDGRIGLIALPPGQAAFERFRILAEIARTPGPHEIDFVTMGWDIDKEPNDDNDSPGDIFLQGIKALYDDVQLNPENYTGGVRIRILLGLKYYFASAYLDQRVIVMNDLADLGIERNASNWTVEVAAYQYADQQNIPAPGSDASGIHSHVKMMIVDGKHVIAGGYNMQYVYLEDNPYHDMGVQISGPIAQSALQVFDGLWAEAYRCDQFFLIQCVSQSRTESLLEGIPHDATVLVPTATGNDVVFSLYRDHTDKTADNAIAAAIGAANSEVNILQARFANSFFDPPQYARAVLDVLQKGDGQVYVNLLASKVPTDMLINVPGICTLKLKLILEDPFGTHNLNTNFSDNPMHTKALSIDGNFVIVGSQNFDLSAWGNDPSEIVGGDLAEYSLGIDGIAAATAFNATFTTESDPANSSPVTCFGIDTLDSILQDAIDQAAPGTIIFTPAGVYTESVTINKPLVLVGAGNQTIFQPEGNQPAFRITSSDVTIMNMKISGSAGYGIELIDSSPSSLKDIQINRVVFENNAQGGVLAQGLIPGSPMNYNIENNTFIGGANGVTINMLETQAETSFIRNNIFSGQSNAPIHVLSANDSRVEYSYNLFDDCGLGTCTTNWIQGNMNTSSSAHDNLFDLDPLFTSPDNSAYQLSTGSPAIDAGNPELFHDFFYDGDENGLVQIDMGAFEYAPVENVAPIVDAGTHQNVELGTSATITATYTDADNSENHSARIDWGDGVVEDIPVTMTGPGAGEVTSEHTYSNAGNYTVEICVIDLYGSVGCDSLTITVNSFPSTSILDDFNRANGGIGSNWSGNTGKYTINANQLKVINNASNSDVYWSSQAFGADQEAYFTFSNVYATSKEQNLLLKSQSNTTWGYGVLEVWYDAPNQRVQVWTYEWPAGWIKHGTDIPVTFAVGDQFGARALADGTVEVYKNGTLLATRDITSWLYYDQGGYIGLWFSGAQNTRVDDFGGGAISSGQQSMLAGSTVRSVTADQLNVTVNSVAQFWQGIPLGQTARVTFTSLQDDAKPQSNGVWGEGTVQVLYDVPNQLAQVWAYNTSTGWIQIGNDISVAFAVGDQFHVRTLSNGTVEIYKNGTLLARRRVNP